MQKNCHISNQCQVLFQCSLNYYPCFSHFDPDPCFANKQTNLFALSALKCCVKYESTVV